MASKTTLNAKNLEGLGAARLAGLLMEMSVGQPETKRRLRLELARDQGASALAGEQLFSDRSPSADWPELPTGALAERHGTGLRKHLETAVLSVCPG